MVHLTSTVLVVSLAVLQVLCLPLQHLSERDTSNGIGSSAQTEVFGRADNHEAFMKALGLDPATTTITGNPKLTTASGDINRYNIPGAEERTTRVVNEDGSEDLTIVRNPDLKAASTADGTRRAANGGSRTQSGSNTECIMC